MATIAVDIINASTVLTDQEVQAAVPDLQTQVHRDFAPAWGIDANLSFRAKSAKAHAGAWQLIVLDNSDQASALGYHDLTKAGLPLGKVFAGSDKQYGLSWTVTASHELLEMLGDPDINLTVFLERTNTSGRLYAYETCDACEDDQFGYKIGATLVSDFVYPAWFESFRKAKSTTFDFGKHITKPFQLLTGGYIGYYDVLSGNGWQQLTADNVYTYAARPRVGSRRERRRTPRDQWMKSAAG
jgi:hypothetical protein